MEKRIRMILDSSILKRLGCVDLIGEFFFEEDMNPRSASGQRESPDWNALYVQSGD